MGTTLFISCSFSWRCHQQLLIPSNHLLAQSSLENGISRAKVTPDSGDQSGLLDGEVEKCSGVMKRRSVFVSGVSLISSAVLGSPREGLAVVKQGSLAGRIPGLSEPDEQGWFWLVIHVAQFNLLRKFLPFCFPRFCFCVTLVKFTGKTYAQTGWRTYRRPDEKSGGHGVGWSPIIPYSFSVPQDWAEVTIHKEKHEA